MNLDKLAADIDALNSLALSWLPAGGAVEFDISQKLLHTANALEEVYHAAAGHKYGTTPRK